MAPTQDIRRLPAVVRLCLGILLLATVTTPAAQPSRIVAIGDVHGAIDELRALLEAAELTDGDQQWTGGNNTLVQTGDLTDRGAGVRAVLDLMMRLETDAAETGGQVLVVLGNHETMSLMANLRDTTPELLAAFADAESESLREEGYADYLALAAARSDALGPLAPQPQSRSAWMDTHPPGFLEYIDAFGPDGRYGRWLRSKPVVVRVGDSIFLHGGLHPSGPTDLDEINDQARRELETYDRQRRQLIDRGLILPFSTFQETLATVSRELVRWSMLVSPTGPPAAGYSHGDDARALETPEAVARNGARTRVVRPRRLRGVGRARRRVAGGRPSGLAAWLRAGRFSRRLAGGSNTVEPGTSAPDPGFSLGGGA